MADSSDLGDIVSVFLIVVFVGVGLWGLYEVATANYFANPVQAFEQQTTGLLAIVIAIPVVLVLIGGAAVVAAVLAAILSLFNRNSDGL